MGRSANNVRARCVEEALLRHDQPDSFVQPQYGGAPVVYVVYRIFVASFFGVMLVYSVMKFDSRTKWIIYLTHWSFIVLAVNTGLQAVCVVRHYCRYTSLPPGSPPSADPDKKTIESSSYLRSTTEKKTTDSTSSPHNSPQCPAKPLGPQCLAKPLGPQCPVKPLGQPCLETTLETSLGPQCPAKSLGQKCEEAALGPQCGPMPLGSQCRPMPLGSQCRPMPLAYRVIWVLQNITVCISPVVTAIYWAVVFQPDVTDVTLVNVSVHVLNTVYVAVDMSVTGVPMCMSHAYHTIVYGLVYLGFAVSYWAAGGTNVSGLPYIYTVLDFDSRPTSTAVWVGGILIAILCMHVLLSGVYRLRVWAYGRLRRRGGERRGGQTDLPI